MITHLAQAAKPGSGFAFEVLDLRTNTVVATARSMARARLLAVRFSREAAS